MMLLRMSDHSLHKSHSKRGQNIEQILYVEAVWQIFHRAWNMHFDLADWAFELVILCARRCQVVEAFKAETM